jgi:hypothetical protein
MLVGLDAFGNVPFCINLADVSRPVAEEDLGGFQAECSADLGRGGMPQAVRGPAVDAGLVAGAVDDAAVGIGGELVTGLSFRLPLPVASPDIAAGPRRLAVAFHFCPTLDLTVAMLETVCPGAPRQITQQHFLGLGADEDDSIPAMVFGLVAVGLVGPYVVRPVEVAWTEGADLLRAAATEQLKTHHVTVDSCDTNIMFNYLLVGSGNPEDLPAKLDYRIQLVGEGKTLEVEPGKTATIPFTFLWKTPVDVPSMLAICRASFTLRYVATHRVETEPVIFTVVNDGQIASVK